MMAKSSSIMNQLAFSSKRQPQYQHALRLSSDSSSSRSQWSPQKSPTHRRSSSDDDSIKQSKQQQSQRHLHVQFAVQNVPPSPLVYQRHTTHVTSPHERIEDTENDRRGSNLSAQRQRSMPRDLGSQLTSGATTAPTTSAILKASTMKGTSQRGSLPERRALQTKHTKKKPSGPRKPAWDADVQHTASLFDTSIKRSTLFQSKAGDRRKETDKETQQVQDRSLRSSASTITSSIQRRTPAKRPNTTRKVKSTISTSSGLQLPTRPVKDFVRLNFERITGRPYDQQTAQTRHQQQQQHRPSMSSSRANNVFDRLSKPQIIPKSLLRSVRFSELPSPKHTSIHESPVAADRSTKACEPMLYGL